MEGLLPRIWYVMMCMVPKVKINSAAPSEEEEEEEAADDDRGGER